MKGIFVLTLAILSLLLTSCGGGSSQEVITVKKSSQEANQPEIVPDEIIIKVKEGEDAVAVAHQVAQEVGGQVIKVSPPYALIKLRNGVIVQSAVRSARENPKVELVDQNRIIRIPRPVEIRRFNDPSSAIRRALFGANVGPSPLIPNDPLFSTLWGMNKILAPQAWHYNTGSNNLVVAVVDSGIDYNHPDLRDNMWRNPGENCGNGVDDDNNGYVDDCHGINAINGSGNPMDDNGHGTHVAGTIGAVTNNSLGVAGVNWRIKLLGCKFVGANGQGDLFNEIECLNYIVSLRDRGENIVAINASYIYYAGQGFLFLALERDAINRLRQRGVLFVAAAGNDALDNDAASQKGYPCSHSTDLDNVLCVASVARNGLLSFFSNYGASTVQVAAPGSNILSTHIGFLQYAFYNGTSMAAPHVAGLAALIKASDPSLGYMEIKNRILTTVDVVPSLVGKVSTGGKINAYRALGGTNPVLLVNPVGSGTVSGSGINCGDECAFAYASGSLVNLTATPGGGATLLDWGGQCAHCGRNTSCEVTVNQLVNCFVTFYSPLNVDDGGSATVGLQGGQVATQYSFNTNAIVPGLAVDFIYDGSGYDAVNTVFNFRIASSPNLVSFSSIDNDFAIVNLPFPVRFYGSHYSQAFVSTNGVISFNWGVAEPNNTAIPNGSLPPLIAAYWDDLVVKPFSRVYWHIEGSSPNRVLVITFENLGHKDFALSPSVEDGITFQVVFYEGDPNRITLQYADVRFFGFTLSVSRIGDGMVTSNVGGITCPSACVGHFGFYSRVRLTASPSSGHAFAGWGGDCEFCGSGATCEIDLNKSKRCRASFVISTYNLTVSKQGSGSGTVTSQPSGINCGQNCSASFSANTQVTLTASPAHGSTFAGWGGDCIGCGGDLQCQVAMNANKTCTATFNIATYTVTVNSTGNGSGSISSSPAGINYSYPANNTGSSNFNHGSSVVITATAGAGSTVSWNGTCTSAGGTEQTVSATEIRCMFNNLNSNKTITATFTRVTYTLTVNKTGAGSGTVTSTPAGIDCGQNCSASFNANTQVTLVASPALGSVFVGWDGECESCGSNTQCTIRMEANRTCTATFNIATYTVTVNSTGNGSGFISSSPAGISYSYPANNTGSASFSHGSDVVITAIASAGSTVSWNGACASAGGIEQVVSPTEIRCVFNNLNSNKTVTATFTRVVYTLTINKSGTGSGTVVSSPQGIDCGQNCSAGFLSNTQVTLTAYPTQDSEFAGWGGDCVSCGNDLQCQVFMNSSKTCTASFNLRKYVVRVNSNGDGTGSISSSPAGISYDYPASNMGLTEFNHGTSVVITATAGVNSVVSWNGSCTSAGGVEQVVSPSQVRCSFSGLSANKTIVATFTRIYTLNVDKQGSGSGAVTSSPQGIDCGQNCSAGFLSNTQVTLTASPSGNSVFVRWDGDCVSCGSSAQCQVLMNSDKSCVAVFNLKTYQITTSVNLAEGGSVVCSPNPVLHGGVSSCSITVNQGYRLVDVAGTCGGSLSGNVFTTNPITQNCTVVVNLERTYAVNIFRSGDGRADNGVVITALGGGCNVNLSGAGPDEASCLIGESQSATIRVVAPDKYAVRWGGDCVLASGSECVLSGLGGDKSVVVEVYRPRSLTVNRVGNAASLASASASVSAGSGYVVFGSVDCVLSFINDVASCAVPYGSTVRLTASAQPGIVLAWSGCSQTQGSQCVVSHMTEGKTVSMAAIRPTEGGSNNDNRNSDNDNRNNNNTPPAPTTDVRTGDSPSGGRVTVSITGGSFTGFNILTNLTGVPENGLTPYGGIAFTARLAPEYNGLSVSVVFPSIPQNARFYKLLDGRYVDVTHQVQRNENAITLVIIDNSTLDANPQLGVISDPLVLVVPRTQQEENKGGSSGGSGSVSGGESISGSKGGGCSVGSASPVNGLFWLLAVVLLVIRRSFSKTKKVSRG